MENAHTTHYKIVRKNSVRFRVTKNTTRRANFTTKDEDNLRTPRLAPSAEAARDAATFCAFNEDCSETADSREDAPVTKIGLRAEVACRCELS